ncbi:hypothetical protein JXB31_00575 [Candidatus Woesearchaeota archaeon]|nr:hypothetical protein [Candidatus Woesearchaeota archaeon]
MSFFVLFSVASFVIYSDDDDKFDHRVDNWYDVSDWEVEVCSRWGGGNQPQSYSGPGLTATSIAGNFETVTVQGQKTVTDFRGEKTYLYEASWYYQPMTGSRSYKVYLMRNSHKKQIYEGSSTAQTGDGNYDAEKYSTDPGYTHILIEYSDSGSLKSEIQLKEVNVE